MADAESRPGAPDRPTSPLFFGVGLLVAAVVIIVAFLVEPDYGWAVLVLTVIIALAAVGYRAITARGGGDTDSTDPVPHQEPRGERPLGDTPEAHDEVSPHDIPKDNPARDEAEEMAGGAEGTTRGPLPGG